MAAAVGGVLQGLLGGSATITNIFLWTVVQQVISALLAPYLTQAQYDVWKANPLAVPSPTELADYVVRSITDEATAAPLAALSGENAEHFHQRVLDTGEPPGLEQVLEWFRRGFIPWDSGSPSSPSVVTAVRTSRIYNYWTPVIQQGQFVPLTPADAVNAWVRGQVGETAARKYLYENGINTDEQTILYNTTGRPPAPTELAEGVRRGFIPLQGEGPTTLSLQQGIIEGDLKDKWEPFYEQLVVRLPGSFDVRRMLAAGAIDDATAASLWTQLGLPANVVAGLVAAGSSTKVVKQKQLSVSTIEKLYTDRAISAADATTDLGLLGYSAPEAAFILEANDLALWERTYSEAITRIRTAYLARHLSRDVALAELTSLGVPAEQQQQVVGVWDVELVATARELTPAQVVDAVYYGAATSDWAQTKLVELGYTAGDAWVLLSVRMHAPQPNPPADAPPVPPPAAGA